MRVKILLGQPEGPGSQPDHTIDLGLYARPAAGGRGATKQFRGWGGSSHPDVTITPQGVLERGRVPGRPEGPRDRAARRAASSPGRSRPASGPPSSASPQSSRRPRATPTARCAGASRSSCRSDPAFAAEPYRPAQYDPTPARKDAGWYAGDMHVHAEHSELGAASTPAKWPGRLAPSSRPPSGRVDGDRRLAGRVDLRGAGREDQVDARAGRSSSRSALGRARVAVEVLGRPELERVDEDRHGDARRPACAGVPDQLGVALVQRAHGRHERERAGHRGPPRGQLGPGPDELGHRDRRGLGTGAVTTSGAGPRRRAPAGPAPATRPRPARRPAARPGWAVIRPAASARPAVAGPWRRSRAPRPAADRRAPRGGRRPCRRRRGTIGPVSAASPERSALSSAACSSGESTRPGSATPARASRSARLVDEGDQVVGAVRERRRGRAGGPPRRPTPARRRRSATRARGRPAAAASVAVTPKLEPASRSRSPAVPVNVIAGCMAIGRAPARGGGREHRRRRARRRCARRAGPGRQAPSLGQPGDERPSTSSGTASSTRSAPARRPRRRAAAARRAAAGRRGRREAGETAGGGDDAVAGGGQGRGQDGADPAGRR